MVRASEWLQEARLNLEETKDMMGTWSNGELTLLLRSRWCYRILSNTFTTTVPTNALKTTKLRRNLVSLCALPLVFIHRKSICNVTCIEAKATERNAVTAAEGSLPSIQHVYLWCGYCGKTWKNCENAKKADGRKPSSSADHKFIIKFSNTGQWCAPRNLSGFQITGQYYQIEKHFSERSWMIHFKWLQSEINSEDVCWSMILVG